ncbi:hypothetical protein E3N88_20247 [Mikania micrantha]|uniref:Uncharacterized protein n=1 Tax=Mikania micrantha TaxID=192012 RepID=A0A5N6NGX8_9ASTR|nr:hypothetical protein E3N88_20247 [Mikania micrantha]
MLASLLCTLAMVADLVHGIRNKKLWFPCKFFTLNAASLAVIAVAIKLPMDLNNLMPGHMDQDVKIGSLAFMCTMMANLLPSLATMDNKELLTNIIALGVLVTTLVVNVCIQIKTGLLSLHKYEDKLFETSSDGKDQSTNMYVYAHRYGIAATFYLGMLLMLLIIYACSSIAILKSKQILDSKYKGCHETTLKNLESVGSLTVEKLKHHVRSHWIMAGTSSPQFVTVCFATTSASGVICVCSAALAVLLVHLTIGYLRDYKSDYKWSTLVIFITQFIGVILGTIAPLVRCFANLSFDLSNKWKWNHMNVFKVESYWTQKLCDWKHSIIPFSISSRKSKIIIQKLASVILSVCVEFQKIVVVACKMIALIPILHVAPLHLEDHLNCWSLTLVTLTTIAVSLPTIPQEVIDGLLSSVSEGLVYVTLVEETFNARQEYVSMQKAAKVLWLQVEVYHKWLGNELMELAPQVKTAIQILECFRDAAENMTSEVESSKICANSMYHTTKAILYSYHATIDMVSKQELYFHPICVAYSSSTVTLDCFSIPSFLLGEMVTLDCFLHRCTSVVLGKISRSGDGDQLHIFLANQMVIAFID